MQEFLLKYIPDGIVGLLFYLIRRDHIRINQGKEDSRRVFQELMDFKNEIYKNYISKDELSERFGKVERTIEAIHDYIFSKTR